MKGDDLSEQLFQFAIRVCKLVDALPSTELGRHVAGQLLRCGTSSPPNYEEARAGESRADFIHKLRICLKELRESWFWIRFIRAYPLLPEARVGALVEEAEQLCNILGKSIVTARKNTPSRKPKPGDHP